MKILVFSHLFPSLFHPLRGLFVLERVRHMGVIADVSVIVPVKLSDAIASHLRRKVRGEFTCLMPNCHFLPFVTLPPFHFLSGLLMALSVLVSKKLRRAALDCDVIDVHWTYPDAVAAYLIGAVYRKPVVITLRGVEAFYEGQGWLRAKLLRAVLSRVDGIIAVSEQLADIYSQRLSGRGGAATVVIPNGVDTKRFVPGNSLFARAHLGIEADVTAVVSVGRVCRGKGYHRLVTAWPKVRMRWPDAKLYILGEVDPDGGDAYFNELKGLAVDYGQENAIIFCGGQPPERLVKWYQSADLFALASDSEGSPNVVLEALACGLPVTVSDVGGVSDIVTNDSLGVLVEVGCQDWSEPICKALGQNWNREAIRSQVETRTWAKCANEAVSFLSSLGDF